MTLARHDFNSQCTDLIKRSRSIQDHDWKLLKFSGGVVRECGDGFTDIVGTVLFLSKRVLYRQGPDIMTDEYNVIYSESYEVPVLYFKSNDKGETRRIHE